MRHLAAATTIPPPAGPATVPDPSLAGGDEARARQQIARISWLHFANDLTLDFLTPLLPAGAGMAWIGLMEGVADAAGHVLKLVTGRASDRSGVRAPWVGAGYLINAVARPLSGFGFLLGLPAVLVACRIADRLGKGVRGSATDAMVADWSEGGQRARDFARIRMMDNLGAALGGLAAAAAAYALAPRQLGWAILATLVVTLWVAVLTRGLRDASASAGHRRSPASGWWPRSPAMRRPLFAIGIANLATRISPLLVLMHVAGFSAGGESGRWPLWGMCLGWAALGLVQAGASAVAGTITARFGPAILMRGAWLLGAGVFVALASASGPVWPLIAGIAFGILTGLTEGAEKTWVAELSPQGERALSFGALALVSAVAGLIGNALWGMALAHWGQVAFLPMACLAVGGALATVATRRPQRKTEGGPA
jgi:MFS family permease